MRPLRVLTLTAVVLSLAACASTGPSTPAPASAPVVAEAPRAPDNYQLDLLNAVSWSRTSAEAEAAYLQAYGMARRSLDLALADPKWTAATEQSGDLSTLKQTAVIVDIDETVLDTSDYMIEQIRSGEPFSKESWNAYTQRENATPLPGALDFLKYAASKNVIVYYVSNREVAYPDQPQFKDEVEPTRRNLAKFGFPNTDSTATFLFRDSSRGWKEKSPRRAEIAKTHRILMLVGDNLYDFIDVENATRAKRDAAVEDHLSWLGTRWIVLPNPMYGSWESLLVGRETRAAARKLKLESLGIPGPAADTIAQGGFEP